GDTPGFRARQAALADSHHNRGLRQLAGGQLARALDGFQKARGLREKLVAADPSAVDYQNALADSFAGIAAVLSRDGQYQHAVNCYQRACAIRRKLVQVSPDFVELRGD